MDVRREEAAETLDALLERATTREPMKTFDSLSGARFERVVIGDDRFVLKHLHVDDDWIQRATGDLMCRPLVAWHAGILDALPDSIDHTIVAVEQNTGRNGWGGAVLMRDVSEWMVPEGSATLPLPQHLRFLGHMAALNASFWGWEDDFGLMPLAHRFLVLTPAMSELEEGGDDPVPGMVREGWSRFRAAAPRSADIVLGLLADPMPLVEALERTPSTLVHGDWKAGNLGSHPDGRTILIDWAVVGRAPACLDLAWYLAVNCDRLPHSKEDAIVAFRSALESHGIDTAGWWEEQLELALLGAFLQLGWSKSGDELAWWDERAPRWARHIG